MIGATGDIGRQICAQLIERRVVPTTSRLQLVGRRGGSSQTAAHGLRADLRDAYSEHAPLIDVAVAPEDVVADVIIMAAGATPPASPGAVVDRRELAAVNARVFTAYAERLAEHGAGHEVVIVVSNPVELAVGILAKALGRHRVIGMGAWLDTLRFRREIASTLGFPRQRIGGFVVGPHGDDMVPLWSTVRVTGLTVPERKVAVRRARGDRSLDDFTAEIDAAKTRIAELASLDMTAAFAEIYDWPPDLRTVTRPWLTHQSGAKTASGTANATVELIDTLFDGREIVVAGQVRLDGEISVGGEPVRSVTGVPVILGPEGWKQVVLDDLAPDEERRLRASLDKTDAMLAPWEV